MDSMLPPVVTAAMIRVANGNATVVDSQLLTGRAFKGVSLLFLDIVSFTTLSAKISPALLVQLLNGIFCRFDEVIARHRAFKVRGPRARAPSRRQFLAARRRRAFANAYRLLRRWRRSGTPFSWPWACHTRTAATRLR